MCFYIGACQLDPLLFVEASVKGDSEHASQTLCSYGIQLHFSNLVSCNRTENTVTQ